MPTLAWPQLDGPGIDDGQQGFHSHGLEILSAHLDSKSKPLLLDLGSPCGANLDFFSRHGCRVYIEDLFHSLGSVVSNADDDSQVAVHNVLAHDKKLRFDAVLWWDLLCHLDDGVITSLMKHVAFCSQSDGLNYLIVPHVPSTQMEPMSYRIAENFKVYPNVELTSPQEGLAFTTSGLEKRMTGFQMRHSFMLRNGVQEYLFSRC